MHFLTGKPACRFLAAAGACSEMKALKADKMRLSLVQGLVLWSALAYWQAYLAANRRMHEAAADTLGETWNRQQQGPLR